MSTPGPVLVAGAPLQWTRDLAALAGEADPLLAADGGADHLARLGLRPRWVVGDLDSLSPATRRWLGEEAVIHRPAQDRSDLDKALSFALDELGLDRLTVLGALGGRTDHQVANLGLLAARAMGERLVFRGADCQVVAVAGSLNLPASPGEVWSFWTFGPQVRVTLAGVRWPVTAEALDPAHRCSLSNVAEAGEVRVEAEGGAVVAFRQLAAATGTAP